MRAALYLTLIIGLVTQGYYFFSLPEIVANHFGNNGIANGWMSKNANFIISSLVIIFNTMIFSSISIIFNNVPVKFISFPNKTYWLAPDRKEHSIKIMSDWFYLFGFITNLFTIIVFHMVFMANQKTPPTLNEDMFTSLLMVYFLFLIIWIVLLFRRFKIRRDS